VTGDSLTDLYISYNFIEKMKGINALKKLKVRRKDSPVCLSASIVYSFLSVCHPNIGKNIVLHDRFVPLPVWIK